MHSDFLFGFLLCNATFRNISAISKGIQRMVKNKWYKRSHWTYNENCSWLIERGIVAFHWSNSQGFHWSIFLRAKWNVLWESPKSVRVDPMCFRKKRGKNLVGKKGWIIISLTLPVTSLPIKSFPVMQLPVTSFPLTSGDVTIHTILLKYVPDST